MNKMGEALEKSLNDNKYDLLSAAEVVVNLFKTGNMEDFMNAVNKGIPRLRRVIAKIYGKEEG